MTKDYQIEIKEYKKIQEDCSICDGYNSTCISYRPHNPKYVTSCLSYVGLEGKLNDAENREKLRK